MRRFLAIAFLSLAISSTSYADLVSTATVNIFNPCGSSTEVMGTSNASTNACTFPEGGRAATSINFGITSSTIATWTFNDGAGQSSTALSTSLFDYEFVVTGGSGPGFLTLNFVESDVMGNNDPQASANFEVVAALNGVQYSDVRICGNPPAMEGIVCMNPTDAIGVAFTYGTPFELSVALNAVAAGGLAHLVPFTTLEGDGTLNYSLPSQSDVLSIVAATVPEPASAILMTTGVFALLIRMRDTM
ncbi:MAG TPA: hypothetical protein VK813_11385 [Edaphobacter sp.]|nr:hypothetical protein [Edaphobacter sp.]